MRVIKGLHKLPPLRVPTAVAIGNFDGVHLGHKKILEELIRNAEQDDLLSACLTFHPHPENILQEQKIPLLQTLDQRLEEIAKFGVHTAVVLRFTRELARLSPEEFVRTILVGKLRAKSIIVGENFRFGKSRQGDVKKLFALASDGRFKVISVKSVLQGGQTVSSSRIRELLNQGKLEEANRFIGRPYEIRGRVVRGSSRGKILGFPTANIRPINEIHPWGVFITNVWIQGETHPAVTHIGNIPTFQQNDQHVESYIIGFRGSLYGQVIRVFLLKKLRDPKKFATPEALSSQIKRDLEQTEAYFAKKSFQNP
ncbi:MAG: riboflavin biosynthesis protein RibF [Candidatus Aminicenantales bacterium]